MATSVEIKKTLEALSSEVPSLVKACAKNDDIPEFGRMYQSWYSRAVKVVELLVPDRVAEFRSYYLIDPKRKFEYGTYCIQDYIKAVGARMDDWEIKPLWDINATVALRIVNQAHILESLAGRIDSVLADVKGHILAEIQDEELAVAHRLLKISLRAAGAVAGVVLEGHLQRVATNHAITIVKKDPSIADLNDPLKDVGVYDIPTWRKIQHLGDIRNFCDHKKSREPTRDEVEELIAGVSSIVKTIF